MTRLAKGVLRLRLRISYCVLFAFNEGIIAVTPS